ncbi:LptF/LptG family permease [Caldithrix abyssi]|uniref:Permease YjgP/YjgQ family protein n=2 Tax=Caldithrix abyssi DSM 13497 TaxID=880073 RepID=H1XNE1_CALAY|nr:LptF/LptG family permease [Caldithrix abyssi]EHO42112.1 permease YjgP/YjgQ family protein [Caldithrix abyssi DSM 13497]
MKILYRYIIKEHIGPFVMSLSVIMFILLMNFLVKYIGQIFGKGLSAWVIIKLIIFNLAWMFALAVPMATLVAVLMAFGRLSSDNEITILKSSGISLYRIIRPALFAAFVLMLAMIFFNDRILPESNHQAKLMFRSIRQKKPTLQLEPSIFYTVDRYTIVVNRIEKPLPDEWLDLANLLGPEYRGKPETDRLVDVTIFDQSDAKADVTITAEEGYMTYSPAKKSLVFTLFRGEFHKMDRQKTGEYERSLFEKQVVYIPAEEFLYEERKDTDRSDREMTVSMMRRKVEYFRNQIQIRQKNFTNITDQNLAGLQRLILKSDSVQATSVDSLWAGISENKWKAAYHKAKRVVDRYYNQAKTNTKFIDMQKRAVNKYLVEIHKKFSIPFASIVFVLIGAPLGIRARKGSMGVGISLSIGFFLLYWVFLIGGEDLADRGLITPFWAMWGANIIVGLAGIYLTWKTVKETSFIEWDYWIGKLKFWQKKTDKRQKETSG